MTLNGGEKSKNFNELIHEKSPYLLQHAQNPVDWHAWGQAAFDKATRANKPIFLSIGYATCHWCHVMETESFEDPEVARLLNENMVAIKVDREERPDLDHIYMAVCQMLTHGGGWPLTVILTPQKQPFFAATYIPKENRFGNPGMLELIPRISEIWRTRQEEVLASADEILRTLRKAEHSETKEDLNAAVPDQAYLELEKSFDTLHGGFGRAPKFPSAHTFMFLLRYWKRTGKPEALDMVEKSLRAMRQGGIYDQLGYGFHRYATDREWRVPHFEKMLYDQAMSALAYLETYQVTGNLFYARTAEEIFDYVLRDLQAPRGGFYSAEDADSEGREGKFYLWKAAAIREVLEPEEAAMVMQAFNIAENGNFQDPMGRNEGENILYRAQGDWEKNHSGAPDSDWERRLASACRKLFAAREKRIRPFKDDKVLTDWNGLMIAALARGSQVLGRKVYGDAARKSMEFIWKNMRRPNGRLRHRYRDGEAAIPALLDDYAFLTWGLMELYEAEFQASDLEKAIELNAEMIAHFRDRDKGGFFFASRDAEDLIVRKKEVHDGALPSGNSAALLNLLRLGHITGRPDLLEKAALLIKALAGPVRSYPAGHAYFLSAYDFALGPGCELVIAGSGRAPDTQKMLKKIRDRFIPSKVVLFRDLDQTPPEIDRIIPGLKHYASISGKATAYVCRDHACKKPAHNIQEMLSLMDA